MHDDNDDYGPPKPYKLNPIRKSLRDLLHAGGDDTYMHFVYHPPAVDKLATTHKLSDLKVELEIELISAAVAYYKFGPYNYSPDQDHPEILKYLKKLSRTVSEFEVDMWIAPEFIFSGAIDAMARHGIKPAPLLGKTGWAPSKHDRHLAMALIRQLRALNDTLKAASQRLATHALPRRGRPREHTAGLEKFVTQLGHFWIQTAKRKFTASQQGAITKSPAVLFIADALFLLDKIPMHAVLTAARSARSKLRNGK